MKLARIAVTSALLSSLAAAQNFFSEVRVNTSGENSNPGNSIQGACVAASSSRFVAVWAEQYGTSGATKDIYASTNVVGPSAWSAPTRVDLGVPLNTSDSELPKLVVTSDGLFHCFWEDARNAGSNGSEDLYYSRSTNGTTWLASPIAINSNSVAGLSDVDLIHVAANGLELHTVWEDDELNGGDVDEVRYARSINDGLTWSLPVLLRGVAGIDCDNPKVVAFGSTVIVAWIDSFSGTDDVVLRRSTNNGATFGLPQTVESSTAGDVDTLMMASDGTLVVIAYIDNDTPGAGTDSVHGILSTDGGVTWASEVELSPLTNSAASARVSSFDLAVNWPDIYVLFASDATSLNQGLGSIEGVHASISNDFGASWRKDVRLDAAGVQPQTRPSVCADVCGVWAMWGSDITGQTKLGRAQSRNRGLSWTYDSETSTDFDFEAQDSRAIVVRESDHTAISLVWEASTGSNELYAAATTGCSPLSQVYCTSATTSDGCFPTLTYGGVPDASASTGFDLIALNLPAQRQGLFFYGLSGRQTSPWGASPALLCLKSPTQRMSASSSGGTLGACNGVITEDWNLFRWLSPSALGSPFFGGEVVQTQCWFRDPAGPKTTSLTNALEFVVQP